MRSYCLLSVLLIALLSVGLAQQADSPKNRTEKTKSEQPRTAEKKTPETAPASEEKTPEAERAEPADREKEKHYDVAEVPPVVTHHQVTVEGKLLKYTATAGRLPIKRPDGKIEAEMFFVAYTLDSQDASKRPLTFAFNGGPGAGSG